MRHPRTLAAAISSPLIGFLAFWLASYGWISATRNSPAPAGDAWDTLVFYGFFGIPVTYFGALVFALPAYLVLKRRKALTPRNIIVFGSIAGVLTLIGFLLAVRPRNAPASVADVAIWFIIGALAGLAGGAVFVVVAGPELDASAN